MIKILTAAFIIFAFALFLYWNNKSVVITEYKYENKNLPEKLSGYRITHISDLQSEYFGKKQKNLSRKVKETHPDIIVATGDFLDRNHTNYEATICALKELVKIAPVYYVNGNHELALPDENTSKFYNEIRGFGVNVIFDTKVTVCECVNIIGISEQTIYNKKQEGNEELIDRIVENLAGNLKKNDLTILLAHEPQFIDNYAKENVNLIFSGHAHGGQIRLPFTKGLYAPGQGAMPKLTSGMHKRENSDMVISRGLGNSIFPFRLFNRPEIVSVEIKTCNLNH